MSRRQHQKGTVQKRGASFRGVYRKYPEGKTVPVPLGKTSEGMTKRQAERKLQGIIKKKPVYLSDYEVERLKAYKATCERQGDDDLVFLDSGQPMTGDHALQQELQKAAEMHGLHLTFHGLRHGAGTILARAGFPLKDIQVRLGYAHLQTTMTYLEEHDEGQQYATEIASQFMRPVVAISPIIATNTATKRGSGSVSV